ncbi:hypothetical protein RJ641_026031 [Dillenia turbinata]|uniref:Uncharacterized protein n=1 Tax=Dillenia turbinata TaxID=194707 RepID=A0AAN8W853_9MAGN
MGACEMHGDEMGEWVAKQLQELEPWNDEAYVVYQTYMLIRGCGMRSLADAGLKCPHSHPRGGDEVKRVWETMKQKKLAKIPGFSLRIRRED